MGIRNFKTISIAPGTVGTVTGIGAPLIPTLPNGDRPKFLWVHVSPGTASGNVIFVTPNATAAGGSAVTGFAIYADNNRGIILNVHGYSHLGYQKSAGSDSSSRINLIPLEDF
jgi:hypothetical protein